jgi:hypothetical protein
MIKLKLNKKKLKNLSLDSRVIPSNVTSKIVGGVVVIIPHRPTQDTRTRP